MHQATSDIAARIAAAAPETFVTVMGAPNRKRRIFIDFHRNARGATAVAPYSLRARNNLPASAPLSWDDLEKVDAPEDFNYSSLPGLVAATGDPWADIDEFARDLPAPSRVRAEIARRDEMAPRASWKGYLKLSLVSCPVRLYPATSANERIRFNQLHKDTHNRINMKPVDPELGLVERSDLVKGYEYEDKQYIILDEGPRGGEGSRPTTRMSIEAFVDEDEVDVIYQDTPYYLAPDGAMAEETFIVLREAMRAAGKVAVARLVLSSRERMVTIGPRDKGMFVSTLRAPGRGAGDLGLFRRDPGRAPDKEMLELAEALIKQKTTKFDPAAYEDRYEAALKTMIKEKLKGHKPIIAAEPARGNVVNLMDALKQSLGQAKPPAPSKARRPPRRRSRRRRSRPRPRAQGGGEEGVVRPAAGGIAMKPLAGHTFGIVGALDAFPRRLAAREVERLGGSLRRGVGRGTTDVVVGRRWLATGTAAAIEARVAAERAAGRRVLGEGGFRRLIGAARAAPEGGIARTALVEQSRLGAAAVDLLALADAFERDEEPFSFRDLILAKKYAGLIAEGLDWLAIARSVHRLGAAGGLTAKALHAGDGRVWLREREGLSEIDGQLRMDLGPGPDLDALFEAAETAEAAGEFEAAGRLYGRCLDADPGDAVAAFNRGNCLRALGRFGPAAQDYVRAAKRDPGLWRPGSTSRG